MITEKGIAVLWREVDAWCSGGGQGFSEAFEKAPVATFWGTALTLKVECHVMRPAAPLAVAWLLAPPPTQLACTEPGSWNLSLA